MEQHNMIIQNEKADINGLKGRGREGSTVKEIITLLVFYQIEEKEM